jgi:hypothetical protein
LGIPRYDTILSHRRICFKVVIIATSRLSEKREEEAMGNIGSRLLASMNGTSTAAAPHHLGKEPEATIYAGSFVHAALAPGQLDHCTQAAIGVDAKGKIAFVERDVKDVQSLAREKGWAAARIVRIQDAAFFFPGFIGMDDDPASLLCSIR